MALTNAFFDAVKSNNISLVRVMMKNSFLSDPTFSELGDMERETVSMAGLYETHDNIPFENDRSKWDEHYMNIVLNDLMYNFSHERMAHAKEVVRFVIPVSKQPRQTLHDYKGNNNHRSYQEQKRADMASGRYRGVKIAASTIACAAIGGGAAAALDGPVILVTAACAAAGGLVAAYVTKEDKGK